MTKDDLVSKDTALKMAIEAFDNIDMSNQTNEECARAWFIEGYVQALEWPPKEALGQPAQESVAFCKHGVPKGVCTLGEKDCNLPAPWQGLSDEDVTDLINFWNISDIEIEPFIEMVARKLKEKNHVE